MSLLRDLSLIWSMIHVLVLFIFFYESGFSRKKTILLTALLMIPLGALNILGVIQYGPERMGQLLALTCTLPSGIFFFIIAQKRNRKFLFTFCDVDTVSYEIIVILTLRNQMKVASGERRAQLLEVQASALEQQIEEIGLREEKLKIQRHDIRHRYSVLGEMLKKRENRRGALLH